MEKKIDTDEYLETLETSTEYPSDADVEDAKNLKIEVSEKHRRVKRKLKEKLKLQNEDDIKNQLEFEKKRLSSTLIDSNVDETMTTTERRGVERHARLQDLDKIDDGSQDKPKRRSRRTKEKGDIKESTEIKVDSTQTQEIIVSKPKHIDRAAIAAALREKRKRDKEADIKEGTIDEYSTLRPDKNLSTRFDVEAINSDNSVSIEIIPTMEVPNKTRNFTSTGHYSIVPEPGISWDTLKQQEMITEQQSFDFFCRQWSEHPKRIEKGDKRPSTQVEADDVDRRPSADLNDTDKLIAKSEEEEELYQAILKNSKMFIERRPATKISTSQQIEEESNLLFVPGPVDMSILNQQPLRNLEDEGIYVGRRAFLNTANERRLASRIQKENQLEWFGEDGRIKILPDPLKEIPYRPLMWNDQFNPIPETLRTENLKPIVSSTTYEQLDSRDPNNSFQMIISLHSLEFIHHHLFSYEHVLAQRIKQLFMAYDYISKQDGLDFFQQRILTLKHEIGHLQDKLKLYEVNDNASAVVETEIRMENYRQEIRNTRTARNNEEAYLRKLKTSIIKTWKQIKNERNNTGMVLTDISVKIKKQLADKNEDSKIWQRDIEEQIEEEKDYFERNYRKEMKIYEEQKALFEKQRDRKALARSRQAEKEQKAENAKNRKSSNRNTDEMDYDRDFEDLKILAEPDIGEPIPPTPFDESALTKLIRTSFEQCRRLPGEDHIHPVLKVTPVSDSNITKEELNRRNMMMTYNYYAELFFNNKKVVTTGNKSLQADFTVRFNERIPIIISQYPEVIILKLFESSGFSSKFLGSTEMDIPLPFKTSENEDFETYNIKTKQHLVHKNCGVGSGERGFSLESIDGTPSGEIITPLFTSMLVYGRTLWAVDENGELMIPQGFINSEKFRNQRSNRDPLLALGFSKILDLQRRQEWQSIESHLDPNDPRDAKLIKALHTNEQLGIDPGTKLSSEYFRLNPYLDEFNFATEDEIDRSLRFRIIQLRNNDIPEFRSMPIPLFDEKVPLELIKDYENRKGIHKKRINVTGFEARKAIHQEFIDKIRDEVLSKFRSSLLKKSLAEMVREDEIPAINEILPKLLNIKAFNRPLQRLPETRKPISVHNVYEMDVEIVIVIQRASNLPVDVERRTLTPFVQVNFQNIIRQTDVLEGINPAWDVELRIPFKPPATITSLDTVKETLLISVYDQQVINMNTNINQKFNTVYERYERHWLGCLEIPFNTIYLNSKIEGNFKLKQPPFVQGYEHLDYTDPMLSVFITLDPEIHPPQILKERIKNKTNDQYDNLRSITDDFMVIDLLISFIQFSSVEDENLMLHIERWQNEMNHRFPKRFRRVTVVNMRCQETLITRYVSSLVPPDELLAVEESMKKQMVARFVSLISFMADALVFPGISDIWSTCDQFLKMLIGDEDEHAVLLCNYFNYLYKDANSVFLCLGEAIPEGLTAYVMTKESDGTIWLWNASTGSKYKSTDSTCPMFKIGLLVNQNNVWANTQQKVQPWELRFDISNRSDWFPLFKSNIHLQTVQPDAICYEEPSLMDVQDFQLNLETQLRSRIMDWRMGLRTSFLIAPRREMIEILKSLEINCGEMNDDIKGNIKKLFAGYKVFGFPINLPYMEIPDVLARVEATGIHLTADPRVEFSIAVYIKPYANTVLSIWIYVTALFRDVN